MKWLAYPLTDRLQFDILHAALAGRWERMQFDQLKRREFITLLGGAAAAWPLGARAQQGEQQRRIGLLIGEDYVVFVGAFREELHKLGWSDGRNLRIDMRPSAAELIAINPDVMIAENTPAVQDLQRHTRTIPIVFVGLGDPVLTGVVASLARPGGNATGFMKSRTLHQRKMVGIAQGDRARHHSHISPAQRE